MIPLVASSDDEFGVFAFGERPQGIIAIGAEPMGVVAIGAAATGVIALASGVARGVIVGSIGVGCGGLVFVCGAGAGIKVGAVGLGVGALEGIGMTVGLWPGPFPSRARAGDAISLEALEERPTGEAAFVEATVVRMTGSHIEIDADGRRVSARALDLAAEDAGAYIGKRALAQLRFDRARGADASYRDAPEAELVCLALADRFAPPPPRGLWYVRVIASAVLAAAVTAATIPGFIW
jgi:hypothetical protein